MTETTSPENRAKLEQLLQKGFAALSLVNLETAGECCKEILTIAPDLVPGHFLV